MKFSWKKISMALIAFAISSQAWSLILIEPYGGYQFKLGGDATMGTVSESVDFSGIGYGARLGIQLVTLMFGVSYDMMNFDLKYGNTTSKTDQTNIAAFVGWNPKLDGIRFWGEYFFEVKNKYTNTTPEGQNKGTGYGVGLGWKFKPWLALNAEYRNWEVKEPTAPAPDKVTGQSIFVSLSLPFDIL